MSVLRNALARLFISLLVSSVLIAGLQNPSHAALEAEHFGVLPALSDAAISPNGNQVAILQNHGGQPVVNIIDLAKFRAGDPTASRAVGMEAGVKPDYVKWVGDRHVVVSVSQLKMFRNAPLYSGFLHAIDTKTMRSRLLHDGQSSMTHVGPSYLRQFNNEVLDWLEDDPNAIVMQFPDPNRSSPYPNVWKVRVSNGSRSLVRRYSENVTDWITDNKGIPRIGIVWRDRGREQGWRIQHPETGKWSDHEDYPGLNPDYMSIAAITDDGRTLILRAYRGEDTLGLHTYDLVEGAFQDTLYQNDSFDVSRVILSKDGSTVVGATYVGESLQKVLFDAYDSTLEEALAVFDDYQVNFIDQSADGTQLLLNVSGPSEPGGLFLYHRGRQAELLIKSRPDLNGVDLATVLSVNYTARDGEKIPSYVTVPSTVTGKVENLPFIVLPLGGPYARDAKRFDWLAQFFANEGYGVLQMNFRGSQGFGKSFADAGRSSWVVMQDDVEDGMRWLLEKGYADPDRSCIAGWSYGGYAALMGVANDPELYQCAIAIAALTDIPETISDARKFVRGQARAERTFGSLMKDQTLLRANNPVDRADDITVPVFIAHGTLDASVEYDQFTKMRDRLNRAGVSTTSMAFDDEDHYMSNQANRQDMLRGIADFLTMINGPSPFLPE